MTPPIAAKCGPNALERVWEFRLPARDSTMNYNTPLLWSHPPPTM